MKNKKEQVETLFKEKYTLTVIEASQFYGIGKNKLYEICERYGKGKPSGVNKYQPFVLKVGKKVLIKKDNFETFLDSRCYL